MADPTPDIIITRPKVLCVRRISPYRLSQGDEAVIEFGAGLLRFLTLQLNAEAKLGEEIAPEWVIPVGAALTAAESTITPLRLKQLNSWPLVYCSAEWSRACTDDESLLAISRIEALGRTSVTQSYEVYSKEKKDLLVRGKIISVSVAAQGPRPIVQTFFLPTDKTASTGDGEENQLSVNESQPSTRQKPTLKTAIESMLPAPLTETLHNLHWHFTYRKKWREIAVLAWVQIPQSLEIGQTSTVIVEVRNNGSIPSNLEISVELPYGFGLDFQWNSETKFQLQGGQSTQLTGTIRALRSSEVNLGRAWAISCLLGSQDRELARISATINVADRTAGKIFYILTEDCETFDGGESTGNYAGSAMLGNHNGFMDPEDYRVQMIDKTDALNKIAEKHGACWTHFWTATQRFAAEWAAGVSHTGAWSKLCEELDDSIRKGSRRHEYAPHIHFDFEPDSLLPPQPRLLYDAKTDGILPNEYYDPANNPEHKYHGWDGSRKGIAYVKAEGSFAEADSKTGSLRKSTRYLAGLTFGGKLSITTRTGAGDFGASAEDLLISKRAVLANGLFANSDAGIYGNTGDHPRGRQLYFCRADNLDIEIERLEDASLVQLRGPEVQIEGVSLNELNAWFDRRWQQSQTAGVQAIVAMTHAMFMRGQPDAYRDTTGGDFEKLDQHLNYVRTRYPQVRFVTASEAVLEFLDYYSPELKAIATQPRIHSLDGSLVIYSIRILGKGIPLSAALPRKVTVQIPAFMDPEEILSLTVLENGEAIATALPVAGRLPEVEFTVRDTEGYELQIVRSKNKNHRLCSIEAQELSFSEQAQYEERPEYEGKDLFSLKLPQLLESDTQAALIEGHCYKWQISGDLFRLIINAMAGHTEPIGRRFHPYAIHSLGLAVYGALRLAGSAAVPQKAELRCTSPVATRGSFELRCTPSSITDRETCFQSVLLEAGTSIAEIEIKLWNR
jgi:hypothetical protein